jgi:hypothetical protein
LKLADKKAKEKSKKTLGIKAAEKKSRKKSSEKVNKSPHQQPSLI